MYAAVVQDSNSKGYYLKLFLTHEETETFTGHNPANIQQVNLEVTGNVQQGLELKPTNIGGRRLQKAHGIRACATLISLRAAHVDCLFERKDRSIIDVLTVAKGLIKTSPFPRVFWGHKVPPANLAIKQANGHGEPQETDAPQFAKEIGLDVLWDAVARVNELKKKVKPLIEFVVNGHGEIEMKIALRPGHTSPVRGQPGWTPGKE